MGQSLLVLFLAVFGFIQFISVGGTGVVEQGGSSQMQVQENNRSGESAAPQESNSISGQTAAGKQYASPPEMTIDAAKSYKAVVHTNKGDFTMELFAQSAPVAVNNFVFLSRERYYDDVVFHRIIESFMIQTGDPTGTGMGGPGYKFKDELNSPHKYEPGIVAMANAGPDTNGSQFFICTGKDSDYLNQMPNYTIFGKVTEGMDTVMKIASTPVAAHNKIDERSVPTERVVIASIDIIEQEAE